MTAPTRPDPRLPPCRAAACAPSLALPAAPLRALPRALAPALALPCALALALALPSALALTLLLACAPARPAAAGPAERAAREEAAPAAPALAPPPPVLLRPEAAPASPEASRRPIASPALPGLEPRAEGGWRLRFPAGGPDLPGGAGGSLGELGRRLAAAPQGRVTLIAQVSGPVADASAARRLSLARGIAVKEALAAGGLPATRIDIRPAGRTEEAVDAVDVLPPGMPPPPR